MYRRLPAAFGAVLALSAVLAPAAHAADTPRTLVVATTGSDAAPGTLTQPLRTVQAAIDLARPGDTITVRGGRYPLTDNLTVAHSGEAARPITLGAYPGERVVIDGEQLPAGHTPLGGSIARADRGALHIEAAYWRISDLELVNGPYGVYCRDCTGNVFARLSTHDNYESGFQLEGASGNNQILDLDSYRNRDPRKNGESADGLAIKEGGGTGNLVRGARLWDNVDDGLDAWKFTSPITVENTVSYGNGYNRWNFPDFAGDGNGFKLGGGTPAPAAGHILRNVLAFDNAAKGLTDNGNPGAITVSRSTSYANKATGFDFDTAAAKAGLTDNLSVADPTAYAGSATTTATGNSWNLSGSWGASAMQSTATAAITAARRADGSLPAAPSLLVPRSGTAIGARF
ncbi:right-handed parallel beta-helix repeat-containing protein [Kitasatospora sp. NE20-6]|uniref:right-handed parallel beta-helix repeat-containing protein n=1 Tax=Kitasatospora sp. NE20-6 TaxID=2859066 RepID=UPI0038B2CDEC